MSPLHVKLLRDLVRLWPQVMAIALVIGAGVATLILGVGAYDSLSTTRARYYEANAFADIFADTTRAPKSLMPEIVAMDGVAAAEARITKLALLDIDDMKEPGSVLLVSLPEVGGQLLNRVYLRVGRLPEPGASDEVAISERFALAHGFSPGDSFRITMNGTQRAVRITGVVLSPEFIYALGPGEIMPDNRRYGIVWMPEATLAAAYGLQGAFSNVSLKLLPGTPTAGVIEKLDTLLAPYGGHGAYGRKDQLSNSFLDSELIQLRAISLILPPIFLLVAAFLVNMTLTRLITLEREQVGLLKALGYSSWAVALHYMEFVGLIAVVGLLIGTIGGSWLGIEVTKLYARSYAFPFLIFSRSPAVYVAACGITFASSMAGAVRAALGAARLPPADAMNPPAPPHYSKRAGGLLDYARFSSQSVVMVSRHLLHWPWRTASGVLGVALAVAVLVGSLWSFGSTEFLVNYTFYEVARQDATISFANPRPISAVFAVARLPGILRAEPVRSVAVTVRNGSVERRTAITGLAPDSLLQRVIDTHSSPVVMPPSGLVVSSALADIMRVRRGDVVTVSLLDGDRRTVEVPVAAVIESYIGLATYMDLDALNRLVGEGAIASGANVSIDSSQQDALFAALKRTPSASFIALETASLRHFRETLAENVSTMVMIYVTLGAIIAFGVIYNFARISLSEQGRELASLRVLGFSRAEVSALLLGEIAAVVLVAQPIGWLMGYGIAVVVANGFSTELYRVPLVVGPNVFAWGSLVVLASALVSAIVVRRRIDRLDMVAVLKTRE